MVLWSGKVVRYWISDQEAMTGKVVVCCASKTTRTNVLTTVLFLWTFGHTLKLQKTTKGYQITAFLQKGEKKFQWAYGREERRHRKKQENWVPQERILQTSNDKERRREVMASRTHQHQEHTWKDTKEEQRERKRWAEGLKDWCKGIELDKVVVGPWVFHFNWN